MGQEDRNEEANDALSLTFEQPFKKTSTSCNEEAQDRLNSGVIRDKKLLVKRLVLAKGKKSVQNELLGRRQLNSERRTSGAIVSTEEVLLKDNGYSRAGKVSSTIVS